MRARDIRLKSFKENAAFVLEDNSAATDAFQDERPTMDASQDESVTMDTSSDESVTTDAFRDKSATVCDTFRDDDTIVVLPRRNQRAETTTYRSDVRKMYRFFFLIIKIPVSR